MGGGVGWCVCFVFFGGGGLTQQWPWQRHPDTAVISSLCPRTCRHCHCTGWRVPVLAGQAHGRQGQGDVRAERGHRTQMPSLCALLNAFADAQVSLCSPLLECQWSSLFSTSAMPCAREAAPDRHGRHMCSSALIPLPLLTQPAFHWPPLSHLCALLLFCERTLHRSSAWACGVAPGTQDRKGA